MQHSVQNDTNGPVVHFIAMTIGSIEYLWCQVIWSPANCSLTLTIVENLRSQSEIPDLEAHSFCEEQVSKLQVSVDHLVFMNVLHCLHQLINIESSFHLVESFASLNQIRERLVLADVQHDVDVLLVLKVSVKSNDVFVVERAVDFDLTSKFLASFGPR